MPQTYWAHTLKLDDIFHSEAHSFTNKRDIIVKRIRESSFYTEDDTELREIVEELSQTTGEDDFDDVWDQFYDWADWTRVCVVTV